MAQYFTYGEQEIAHLKARDKRLAEIIELIGPVRREVVPDLFEALIHAIVGQQIATRAQQTIWARMRAGLGAITPGVIRGTSEAGLQAFGLSFRKVGYMKAAAERVLSGEFDVEALRTLPDDALCAELARLPGVGVWTAEMLMTFSLQRPDVISYGDLAIQRGLRMLYRHRRVDRKLFDKYRRRYAPHATVASLYLWAVAGGAVPGLTDPAPKATSKVASRSAPRRTTARKSASE
ncbi:DNA-3-methyladenine glycosylase family protein [Desulfovibrio fairfieldensis]|uniref:DNA-3-methyladenine glycosylase II n=1 Tax=Desulfovibrio fairfieldensis TaxID=44742 RepID=A0A0X8JKI2_9BACT|nr:DNA-3-methyladenine glycosylase [Desulfovibrio fairfieldensis]AMD90450.1 DNA-3-methyladenine glycosidase [Desulfovibrio fairfieldensis]